MTTTTGQRRVWFITGASKGLGRAFTEAALAKGDRVVAVSRGMNPPAGGQDDLLTISLDVTRREDVFAAVDRAVEHFGRIDVVVNNAGNLSMGMIEEFTEEQARAQMETNFFGALWVSQAVLPVLRRQGAGRILQVSSISALGGFPMTGLYSASKFALEGMSEALAAEAVGFGVKVTIVQPGGYWTDLYSSPAMTTPLEDYTPLREEMERMWAGGSVDSDPALAAEAVLKLVDDPDPPRRLLLGSMVYDLARDLTRQRLDDWARWEEVSRAAEHAIPAPVTRGT
ncbi:SDR family NAD(P)-dependent oxidoreductase [Amycolatopsis endophytica]|uniref:NAD(P)-dependent dehydrogenase (Short-subunit alcohol dehydrogenase family) n=1 Tax=Amycolatopsis endophytica TaxID=860233 RepID=A0A853B6L1_9PSEU|nr:SDR family oxidoreductase [Amycolatopsis endophytica]NYI90888.1 NAD(P)-dependent dehydrogenase (short-subunit alcohol dehydrogenase family) [Amycolatopsis endophytica]